MGYTVIPRDVKIDGKTLIKDTATGEIKVNINNQHFGIDDKLNVKDLLSIDTYFQNMNITAQYGNIYVSQDMTGQKGINYNIKTDAGVYSGITMYNRYFKTRVLEFKMNYNILGATSWLSVGILHNSTYYAYFGIKSTNVYLYVNGQTSAPTYTPTDGDTFKIVVKSSSVSFYLNGNLLGDLTTTYPPYDIGGNLYIHFNNNSTNMEQNDIEIYDIKFLEVV